MATISWYETLEGKLAICLAVLLVVLTLVMTQGNRQHSADPLSDTPRALSNRTFQETQVSNLAELPPLTPSETSTAQLPSSKPAPSPSLGAGGKPSVSEDTQPKGGKHRYPLLKLLFP